MTRNLARSSFTRGTLTLAVALTLAACGSAPAGKEEIAEAAETASESTLGSDLTGAACRSESRSDITADPNTAPPIAIYCGKSKRPSGYVEITLLPLNIAAEGQGRREVLEKAAAVTPAGRDAALKLDCEAGSWSQTADGLDVKTTHCSLSDGDWPQVAEITGIGKYLVTATGLPATLPVLERAMAQLAEYEAPQGKIAFGGADEAKQRAVQAAGTRAVSINTDEVDRFSELKESARVQNSRNDYTRAEDAFRNALNIQERALGDQALGVGVTLTELALQVSNQGRFEEAAGLFRRADPIIQRNRNAQDEQARFFTSMAYDAANQGKYEDALKLVREATNIWRILSQGSKTSLSDLSGGDPSEDLNATKGELAHSLNVEAAMALRTDDLTGAETAAKEALSIVGDVPNLPPWWRPDILSTIGEVYARQGQLAQAEVAFRGALIFRQRLFGDTAPTALTYIQLGSVYSREGLWPESVRSYQLAIGILSHDEVARSGLVFDEVAPFIVAANEFAAKDPTQREKLNSDIFKILQFMGAGITDQTITRAAARMAATDPKVAELVRELQESQRRRDAARITLAHETSRPDDERGSAKEDALLQSINLETQRVDTLNKRIQEAFPDYANFANPGAMDILEMQKRLGPKEALVQFQFSADQGFAIVTRSDSFSAKLLNISRDEMVEAVTGLRRALVVRNGVVEDFDIGDSYELYQKLFGPIAAEVRDVTHMIVVPSGALASLPMGLLVTQKPTSGTNYRTAAWLARTVATSLVPSVRAFAVLRDSKNQARAPQPYLAFGNPNFEGQRENRDPSGRPAPTGLEVMNASCRESGPAPAAMLRTLAPLPDTANEVQTIGRILTAGNDAVILGANSTEANLRKMPLDQYRVLYFATHGLLPGELKCQSEPALALSPPAVTAQDKDSDGLLEASEIADLRLNADLVVLSACNTASGGGKFGGESLSGLAEAFFHAGARTLIASHWQVPSGATVRLMTGMFERLGPELKGGVSEMMRQSQLQLISQASTSHPFNWAAFTVIGDGAPAEMAAPTRQAGISGQRGS